MKSKHQQFVPKLSDCELSMSVKSITYTVYMNNFSNNKVDCSVLASRDQVLVQVLRLNVEVRHFAPGAMY